MKILPNCSRQAENTSHFALHNGTANLEILNICIRFDVKWRCKLICIAIANSTSVDRSLIMLWNFHQQLDHFTRGWVGSLTFSNDLWTSSFEPWSRCEQPQPADQAIFLMAFTTLRSNVSVLACGQKMVQIQDEFGESSNLMDGWINEYKAGRMHLDGLMDDG